MRDGLGKGEREKRRSISRLKYNNNKKKNTTEEHENKVLRWINKMCKEKKSVGVR